MNVTEGSVATYETQSVDNEWRERLGQRFLDLLEQRLREFLDGARGQSGLLHLLRCDVIGLHAHLGELQTVGLVHFRMGKLIASAIDGGFAEDDVFGVHLIEVLRFFRQKPNQVADAGAVGEMADDTDFPWSHGKLLKAQDAAFNLHECFRGEFVDGIEFGTVHMLIGIVLQQVAIGLDAQFPLQHFLPLGTYARQEFDVLFEDVIHGCWVMGVRCWILTPRLR